MRKDAMAVAWTSQRSREEGQVVVIEIAIITQVGRQPWRSESCLLQIVELLQSTKCAAYCTELANDENTLLAFEPTRPIRRNKIAHSDSPCVVHRRKVRRRCA